MPTTQRRAGLLARIDARKQGKATPPQTDTKKGIWDTLKSVLNTNKKQKEMVVNQLKPAPNTPPPPPSNNTQPPANNKARDVISDTHKRRAEERFKKRAEKVYADAIRKEAIKEGTLESIQFRESITESNIDKVADVISKAPDIVKTRKQNMDQQNAMMRRRQLTKHVDYVDPTKDNNILATNIG